MPPVTHVVVVDDDPEIRETLRLILEREGFVVSLCADADSFWTVAAAYRIDLALLDIRLPGEDGVSIARRLRAESDIGIIMVTGVNETIDKVVGLEVGADDYVGKPFDRHELVARIRAVLRRRQHLDSALSPLMARVDSLAQSLEAAASRIADATGRAETLSRESTKPHPLSSCPTCGSVITYRQAEKGRLGICGACGWTHFLED